MDLISSDQGWSHYSGRQVIVVISTVYVGLVLLIVFLLFLSFTSPSTSISETATTISRAVFLVFLVVVNIAFILMLYSALIDYNLLHGSFRRIYSQQTLEVIQERVRTRLERSGIEVSGYVHQQQVYPRIIPGFLRVVDHVITTKEPTWRINFVTGRDADDKVASALYVHGSPDAEAIHVILDGDA